MDEAEVGAQLRETVADMEEEIERLTEMIAVQSNIYRTSTLALNKELQRFQEIAINHSRLLLLDVSGANVAEGPKEAIEEESVKGLSDSKGSGGRDVQLIDDAACLPLQANENENAEDYEVQIMLIGENIDTGTGSGTVKTEIVTGTQTGIETETRTWVQTEAKSKIETGTWTGIEPGNLRNAIVCVSCDIDSMSLVEPSMKERALDDTATGERGEVIEFQELFDGPISKVKLISY